MEFGRLQILVRSEQIRREADNAGPRMELDYWKTNMAKFNILLEQLKSAEVKAVIGILQCAKSKLIAVCFCCIIYQIIIYWYGRGSPNLDFCPP